MSLDFNFWGCVHDVKACNSNLKFYVESKCWASQRKHTEYTQNIVVSKMQKSNAADEMESEEKEGVMVRLHETYASCVPCPAGTVYVSMFLRYSFSCNTMHPSLLHQQRLPLAQIQSPVVRSYMGSLERDVRPKTKPRLKLRPGSK